MKVFRVPICSPATSQAMREYDKRPFIERLLVGSYVRFFGVEKRNVWIGRNLKGSGVNGLIFRCGTLCTLIKDPKR